MRRSVASSGGVDTSGFQAVSVGSEYWEGKKRLTAGILDGLVEIDHWDGIGLASPAMDALINDHFSKIDSKWIDAVSDIRGRANEYQAEAARIRSLVAPSDRMSHAIANQLQKLSRAESRLADAIESLGGFDRSTALRWLGNIGAAAGLAEIGSAAMEGDLHQVGVKSSGVIGGLLGSALGGAIGRAIVTEAFFAVGGASAVTLIGIPALCAAVGGFVGGKIGEEIYEWAQGNPTANAILDETFDALYDHIFFDSSMAQILDALGFMDGIRERFGVSHRVGDDFAAAIAMNLRRDPFALDLDGDGIETISVDVGTLFDHDADGVKTGTGWLKGDDGWLVRDLNGNGTIDTGRELFGVDTLLRNGFTASDGFALLRDLDENWDGQINSNDAVWGELKIWRDLNQDGISQAGELSTLAAAGVTSLGTASTLRNHHLGDNNYIYYSGEYTKSDGTKGISTALDLGENKFLTKYAWAPVSGAAADLPDMEGSGAVRRLREAMSEDDKLRELVAHFAAADSREKQMGMLEDLVDTWGGTANILAGLEQFREEPHVEGRMTQRESAEELSHSEADIYRMLKTLEQFNNRSYLEPKGEPVIVPIQNEATLEWENVLTRYQWRFTPELKALIYSAYEALKGSVYQSLVVQTRLSGWYEMIDKSVNEKGLVLDFSRLDAHIATLAKADATNTLLDVLAFVSANGSTNLLEMGWNYREILKQVALKADPAELPANYHQWLTEFIVDAQYNGKLEKKEGNVVLLGSDRNNEIVSGYGADLLLGGAGDDTLRGDQGNDTFRGGVGNDTIEGGSGADTYLLAKGDGRDYIADNQGSDIGVRDVLQFGEGITPDQILFYRVGSDLVVSYGEADSATLFGWYDFYQGFLIEDAQFADGRTIPMFELMARNGVRGTSGNDNLPGTSGKDRLLGLDGDDSFDSGYGDDLIEGGAGNDNVRGGYGSDTLWGGVGNDSLDGDEGADTYIFNLGDGQDRIGDNQRDNFAARDVLQFGAGISPDHLNFSRNGSDLVIAYSAVDSITVFGWYDFYQNYLIEDAKFADGSIFAVSDLIARQGMRGTSGNDNLVGGNGHDSLLGYAGNDVLVGGKGNDVLDGGEGVDDIKGGEGNDTLVGAIGNDLMDGQAGDDVYVFNLGDGLDRITENTYNSANASDGGSDTLQFGVGIDTNALKFSRSGNDLIVRYSETDAVTVVGWFGAASYGIEQIRFADGTVVAVETLLDSRGIQGTANGESFNAYYTDGKDYYLMGAGDDRANGAGGDDSLFGEAGSDSLNGGLGNDILNGGTGNDTLDGHVGDDTYVFNVGDGLDRITENFYTTANPADQGFDTLQFGAGIDTSTLKFSRNGNDLIVSYSQADAVTLVGWFAAASYGIEQIRFVDGSVVAVETLLDSHGIHGTANGESFSAYYNDGKDYFLMGAGDDRANGVAGDDLLFGEAGNDSLNGGLGNDMLNGGIGNDTLDGNLGNDSYVFNLGDGQDRIAETWGAVDVTGTDTLVFGAGITADSLVVSRKDQDLVIKYSETDVVTVVAYFNHAAYKVEQIQFADGSTMTTDALLLRNGIRGTAGNDAMVGSQAADLIFGDAGNDTLNADAGNDLLHGEAGNDSLNGALGADMLNGGIGNDTLDGGEGNDVYLFNLGDGADRIAESYGWGAVAQSGLDTMQFGVGVKAEDLRFSRVGQDLIVKYSATDEVAVTAYFNSAGYRVEQVQFADGSVVAMDALLLRNGIRGSAGNDAMTGTAIDDQLYGDAGNDTLNADAGNDLLHGEAGNDSLNGALGADMLNGGIGNDTLDGGEGNDVYLFNLGDGVDRVAESYGWGAAAQSGLDTLQFGAGIKAEDLRFTRVGQDLVVKYSATDEITVAAHFNSEGYRVEQIKLADGTVLNTQEMLLQQGLVKTSPVVRMPQMEQAAISANRQLNALVDAMASFAPTEMGSLNLSTQLEEQYRPMAVNTL